MELEKLKAIIADILDLEEDEITAESKFVEDLGADSLDVAEIVVQIEDTFHIEVPDDAALSIVTVGDAVEAIKKAL